MIVSWFCVPFAGFGFALCLRTASGAAGAFWYATGYFVQGTFVDYGAGYDRDVWGIVWAQLVGD